MARWITSLEVLRRYCPLNMSLELLKVGAGVPRKYASVDAGLLPALDPASLLATRLPGGKPDRSLLYDGRIYMPFKSSEQHIGQAQRHSFIPGATTKPKTFLLIYNKHPNSIVHVKCSVRRPGQLKFGRWRVPVQQAYQTSRGRLHSGATLPVPGQTFSGRPHIPPGRRCGRAPRRLWYRPRRRRGGTRGRSCACWRRESAAAAWPAAPRSCAAHCAWLRP